MKGDHGSRQAMIRDNSKLKTGACRPVLAFNQHRHSRHIITQLKHILGKKKLVCSKEVIPSHGHHLFMYIVLGGL